MFSLFSFFFHRNWTPGEERGSFLAIPAQRQPSKGLFDTPERQYHPDSTPETKKPLN